MSNEELVNMIALGDETAYEQLFYRLRPAIIAESRQYVRLLEGYDMDDFLQIGFITLWEIISRGNYKPTQASFATYFSRAIRRRFIREFRDYVMKNPVCAYETVDIKGNATRVVGFSEYAEQKREKHRAECRRSYEKKKAAQPPKPKKPKQSKEERIAKQVAYQQAYYATHPDKYEERKAKMRAYMRERYRREKAEKGARRAAKR